MRRISAPAPENLLREFNERVPDRMKSALVRGLIRIALMQPNSAIWDIVANENSPERFRLERTDG